MAARLRMACCRLNASRREAMARYAGRMRRNTDGWCWVVGSCSGAVMLLLAILQAGRPRAPTNHHLLTVFLARSAGDLGIHSHGDVDGLERLHSRFFCNLHRDTQWLPSCARPCAPARLHPPRACSPRGPPPPRPFASTPRWPARPSSPPSFAMPSPPREWRPSTLPPAGQFCRRCPSASRAPQMTLLPSRRSQRLTAVTTGLSRGARAQCSLHEYS